MNKAIKADLYRYGKLTGWKGFWKGIGIPGFRYMYFLRKAAACKKYSPAWLFYSYFRKRYMYKYGIQVPTTTRIGEGCYIGHFGNIVINEQAIIGKNCNIAHGTTIGKANRGKLKGTPVIGDKVWIGTGVVIVGNIAIGSNVLIAPLTYVNFDIPSNSVVVGNPAKIIEKADATEGYINYILNEGATGDK